MWNKETARGARINAMMYMNRLIKKPLFSQPSYSSKLGSRTIAWPNCDGADVR